MTGLAKQLHVSLLVTLGVTVFGLVHDVLDALWSGNLLGALGAWAGVTAILCVVVAVAHTAIYVAAHSGRPEGSEARGVRAGLLILLVLDAVLAQPLWARTADASGTPFRTACALVALIPPLTALVSWVWARRRERGPDIARNSALFFGVVAVPLQGVAALVLLAVA
ncbi:hypothetical protein AB0D59_06135 [Streptomyces sp. NPDC048417]|uniref:hypothetical protein n=1 Tax=Streptomyces sp. NPDC048417 TaxID=3155387 RepID=UPI00342189CF